MIQANTLNIKLSIKEEVIVDRLFLSQRKRLLVKCDIHPKNQTSKNWLHKYAIMLAAKNVNSGTKALQQIFYGVLDFTLHSEFDPDGEKTTTDIVASLQNEITFYPYQDGTHMEAAFGHLNGYGAAYYGYNWSKVYAQDMFSVFEEKGIMNKDEGMRYRKIILEKGGTEDPLSLVKEFLGREPNSDAFLRNMGLDN